MKLPFKKGQQVYDYNGRIYEFFGVLDSVALVRQVFEGLGWEGDPETYASDLVTLLPLSQISESPPVAAIAASVQLAKKELTDLNRQIAASRAAIKASQEEIKKSQAEMSARLARITRFSALARIEDYIDGKITHFALNSGHGRIDVKTYEDTMLCKETNRFNGEVKLLSLFGTNNKRNGTGNFTGDLLWKVNEYYDGSGSRWHTVQPCLSESEAIDIATGWLHEIWNAHRTSDNSYSLQTSIDSAKKIGVEIPIDIAADVAAIKHQANQLAIENARAALNDALEKAGRS